MTLIYFSLKVFQLRDEHNDLGEAVTDERLTNIIFDALSKDMYSTAKIQSRRDPELGVEDIISLTKTIFTNRSEKSSVPKRSQDLYRKVRNSGYEPRVDNVRESAMTFTYHKYKKPGYKIKDCKELMKTSDTSSNVENVTKKWCSYHHSNGLLNDNCYQQQQKGGARTTRAEATWTTSAITREMVAVILPLTVKLQKMRRSMRTVM